MKVTKTKDKTGKNVYSYSFWYECPFTKERKQERRRTKASNKADCEQLAIDRFNWLTVGQVEERAEQDRKDQEIASYCPTVSEYKETFMKKVRAGLTKKRDAPVKQSEIFDKENIFKNHILPILGDLPLNQVTRKVVKDFREQKVLEGLTRKTVNNLLAVLGRMLTEAVTDEILNSRIKIEYYARQPPPFDYLSFVEAERFVKGAPSEFWRVWIIVQVKTGLRLGEMRALRWCNVDLELGIIHVRESARGKHIGLPKGDKIRAVVMTPEVVRALRSHPRRLGCDLVFPNAKGVMLTESTALDNFKVASERAGLRKITTHVLRHTTASHMAMRGIDPKTIQEQLGHSDLKMTQIYTHLEITHKAAMVARLDEPVLGEAPKQLLSNSVVEAS